MVTGLLLPDAASVRGAKGEGRCFADEDEAMMAYLCGQIDLQSRITVRIARKWDGEVTPEYMAENHITGGNRDHIYYKRIETCLGRLILNSNVPQDMGFKPRNTLNDMFELEIDMKVGKKQLGQIVDMLLSARTACPSTATRAGRREGAGLQVFHHRRASPWPWPTLSCRRRRSRFWKPPKRRFARSKSSSSAACITDEERYDARRRGLEQDRPTTSQSKIMDYTGRVQPHPHDGGFRRARFHFPGLASSPACAA